MIEFIPFVLNRFRCGKIGVKFDIRKAFLHISSDDRDRDYLSFLCLMDANPKNFVEYKNCRVDFRISSSSFLFSATLAYHLDQAFEDVRGAAFKFK